MSQHVTTLLSSFQTISLLGSGTYADVVKVIRKTDDQIYALKKIRLTGMKEKDKVNALNQIRILASENAENVIKFKEAFYDEPSGQLCIVMEYAQKGDLLQLIQSHAKKNTKIPENEIWKAMVHMANGLRSLHAKNILHRDLKGANVFITSEGVYKLGDLNVSKVIKNDDLARTQTGTPYYASPQVWKDQPYGPKSDMWSLGCVLYEMAAQRPPFTANDVQTLYKKILNGFYPRIPNQYSDELAETIASLLKQNPKERPSASSLIRSSIVQKHYSFEQDQNIHFNWQASEDLLSTIRLPQLQRNYKQINDVLPKPQYQNQKEKEVKEDTIVGSFFKFSEWRAKPTKEKEQSSSQQSSCKNRLSSVIGEDEVLFKEISSNIKKRTRGVSQYHGVQKVEGSGSSINKIGIFQNLPSSSKISRKLPETPSILPKQSQYADLSKPRVISTHVASRKQDTVTCRKKIQSVVSRVLVSQTSRGRNKENFRRVGQSILNAGVGGRKQVRAFCMK